MLRVLEKKILMDSFETTKEKEVFFYKRQKEQGNNRNAIQQIFVECYQVLSPGLSTKLCEVLMGRCSGGGLER